MNFNKITRGSYRAENNEQSLFEVLDAGFVCHFAFQAEGQTQIIPTAYGRKDDILYFHGSAKNHALLSVVNGQTISVSITLVDGLVLATSLFDSSINYRSVVVFGKPQLVADFNEKITALELITEQIIKGRKDEISIGSQNQIDATLVLKMKIDSASVKIRTGEPQGDENNPCETWSGIIPLKTIALKPEGDSKFNKQTAPLSPCVSAYYKKHQFSE
ncbi:MAG: pyridoxamine 5'-phosphate oxidase family protein [Sediminibacterium sp.]|nr:pyridoxamine 5'-phosphate oxidase family protein [Sediminibacterium sp.]